jgi:hypothetical protein
MLRCSNRKARRAALRPRKPPTSADRIRAKCSELGEFLVAKNRSYGDSALKPVGIFAKGRASDLIRVRLDDKLNRIRNAPDAFGEDVVKDLLGYLLLYQLALEDEGSAETESGTAD